jgi:hypothetical protein
LLETAQGFTGKSGAREPQKSAISQLRTLRSRAFFADDFAGKGDALTAFGAQAERLVRLAGTGDAATRGLTHIMFPDSIANANDHRTPHSRLRVIYGYCD